MYLFSLRRISDVPVKDYVRATPSEPRNGLCDGKLAEHDGTILTNDLHECYRYKICGIIAQLSMNSE